MAFDWANEVREQIRFGLGLELIIRKLGGTEDANHLRTQSLDPLIGVEWTPGVRNTVVYLADKALSPETQFLARIPDRIGWELSSLLGSPTNDTAGDLLKVAVDWAKKPENRSDRQLPQFNPKIEERFVPSPIRCLQAWLSEARGLAAWEAWWCMAQDRPNPQPAGELVNECNALTMSFSRNGEVENPQKDGEPSLKLYDKMSDLLKRCAEALQAVSSSSVPHSGWAAAVQLAQSCQKVIDLPRADTLFWPPRELLRFSEQLREDNPDLLDHAAVIFLREMTAEESKVAIDWERDLKTSILPDKSSWQIARVLLLRVLIERLRNDLASAQVRAAILTLAERILRLDDIQLDFLLNPRHPDLKRLPRQPERGLSQPILTHAAAVVRPSRNPPVPFVPFTSAMVCEPIPRSRVLSAIDEFVLWAKRNQRPIAELAAGLAYEWDRHGGPAEWWKAVSARHAAGDLSAVEDKARLWFFLQCAELSLSEAESAIQALLVGLVEAGFCFSIARSSAKPHELPGPWLTLAGDAPGKNTILSYGTTIQTPDGKILEPGVWLIYPPPGPPRDSVAGAFAQMKLGLGLAALRLIDPEWKEWDSVAADVWAGTPDQLGSQDPTASRRLALRFLRRTWQSEKTPAHPYYLRFSRDLLTWLESEARQPLGIPLEPNTLRPGRLKSSPSGYVVRWVASAAPPGSIVEIDPNADGVAVSVGPVWPPEIVQWQSLPDPPSGCPILEEWTRQIGNLPWLAGELASLKRIEEQTAARFMKWVSHENAVGEEWLDRTVRDAILADGPARTWLAALACANWFCIYPNVNWTTGMIISSQSQPDPSAKIEWLFHSSPAGEILDPVGFFSTERTLARYAVSRGKRMAGTPADLAERLVELASQLGNGVGKDLSTAAQSIAAVERSLAPKAQPKTAEIDAVAIAFLDRIVAVANRISTPVAEVDAKPNYTTLPPDRWMALDSLVGEFRKWASSRDLDLLPAEWSFASLPDARNLLDVEGCFCRLVFREAIAIGSIIRADAFGLRRWKSIVREAQLLASVGKEPDHLNDLFDDLKSCNHPEAQGLLNRLRGWPRESLMGRLVSAAADLFIAIWDAKGFRQSDPDGFQRATESVTALMASLELYTLFPESIQQFPSSWIEVPNGNSIQTGRVRRIIRPVVLDAERHLRIPGIVEAD